MSTCACMCAFWGWGVVRATQEMSIKGSEVNEENWGRGLSKVHRLVANNFQALLSCFSF